MIESVSYPQLKSKISQKNHNPDFKPSFSQIIDGGLVNPNLIRSDSIILDDRGKKRFSPNYSKPEEFKSSCKIFDPIERSSEISVRGKKSGYMQQQSAELIRKTSRHFPIESQRQSNTAFLPIVGWKKKKVVMMENGQPSSSLKSSEHYIESTMNRKQRILDSLSQRNSIPIAHHGDKPFREVQHSSGYYAEGGLITGSTISIKKSGKPTLRKSADQTSNIVSKPLEANFKKKMEEKELEYDKKQVLILNNSTLRQGQSVPSWEDRTGAWLVRPEDEIY
eukprot:gene12213-16362_t